MTGLPLGTVAASKAVTADASSNISAVNIIESNEFHSQGTGHLKFKGGGNDIIFYPQDTETLQITRSGTDCRFTSNGGTGTFKFNQETDFAGGLKLGGTAITATGAELNFMDGVTSNVQTQIDSAGSSASAGAAANEVHIDNAALFLV